VKIKEVDVSYIARDFTMTSQGQLAVVGLNSFADIYDLELEHQRQIDLSPHGSTQLFGITRKDAILLVSERGSGVWGIHVVNENGTHRHRIPLSWEPFGLELLGNSLFVADRLHDNVKKLELDSDFNVVATAEFKSLTKPLYVYISNCFSRIVVSTMSGGDNMQAFSLDGQSHWNYTSDGTPDDRPKGITMDGWGRYIVANSLSYRIMLVDSEGHFIMNVVSGMKGKPRGVFRVGNSLYVGQSSPNKLIHFKIF
jgi:hypothetical protein